MSARVQIAAIAKERGWDVADNGRFIHLSKREEGRYISVTLSVRGGVTAVSVVRPDKPGYQILGSDKAERVISELVRDG